MAHLFEPRFWTDPKVRAWPEPDRLLALYALTCADRATEGLYRFRVADAADDLCWDAGKVRDGLRRLETYGFLKWDEKAGVILLLGVMRGMAGSRNPNQIKGAVNKVDALPPSDLLRDLYA